MEKKKRVRPTVTQVNELKSRINDLEAENTKLRFGISKQQKDFDSLKNNIDGVWEEKNKMVKLNAQLCCNEISLKGEIEELQKKIEDLEIEKQTISSSNKLLETELDRVREANASLKKRCAESEARCEHLLGRGFWERLFNKQLED